MRDYNDRVQGGCNKAVVDGVNKSLDMGAEYIGSPKDKKKKKKQTSKFMNEKLAMGDMMERKNAQASGLAAVMNQSAK